MNFMRADGQHIHAQRVDVNGHLEKSLHRVAVEHGVAAAPCQHFAQGGNGVDCARLVIDQHNRHQRRIVAQGCFKRLGRDGAVFFRL